MCICVYVCTYVYMCVYVCIHVDMCMFVYVCMYVCLCMYLCLMSSSFQNQHKCQGEFMMSSEGTASTCWLQKGHMLEEGKPPQNTEELLSCLRLGVTALSDEKPSAFHSMPEHGSRTQQQLNGSSNSVSFKAHQLSQSGHCPKDWLSGRIFIQHVQVSRLAGAGW